MRAVQTPWGPAQTTTVLADGITNYSTAGHGGIHLSAERLAQMPADLRVIPTYAGDGWYEEDCDWAIVCLAFPEAFKPEHYKFAVETCRSYAPSALTSERVAKAAEWTASNGDKWAQGSAGTADKGWFVNIYNVAEPEKQHGKTFPGIPLLPAVFTLDQFENAEIYKG